MATTAFIAAKPFQTFAKISAPVTGIDNNSNALLLLHSNNFAAQHIAGSIKVLKDRHANVVVLNTGNEAHGKIKADAAISTDGTIIPADSYTLFNKGNIKIGVLRIAPNSCDADQASTVATYLKKEKHCDMVICLSQLGFRNKGTIDDVTLAATSADIDVILGGHTGNTTANPFIALNKLQQEVIIDHSNNAGEVLNQVAIRFNNDRQKINIDFGGQA